MWFRRASPPFCLQASNFCTGQCDSNSGNEAADAVTQLIGSGDEDLTKLRSGRGRAMALESVRKVQGQSQKRRSEPKSLCDGSAGGRLTTCLPNDPPYRINNAGSGLPLNTLTIDADATHGQC